MPEDSFDHNLPALVEPSRSVEALRSFRPVQEAEVSEAPLPITHYLWILKRHRWKILPFVVASVLATLIASSRLTPIYEARTTIDVDRQSPTGLVGQDATRTTTNDADQFLATQVRLIQSDSVLRPVAQKYRLLELENGLVASTEAARSQAIRAEEAPVSLKQLKVDSPRKTYLILISYRAADPRLASDVSNAIAQSYLEHTFDIRYKSTAGLSAFMEKQLEELKAKVERSSAALAHFEQELNVINPEQKTTIISARLLQLNSEYTLAEADRVKKEAAIESVNSGTLEAAQVSSQGEALRKLSDRVDEAEARYAEVKAHYGANHPENKKALAQWNEARRQLEQARDNIARRVAVEYRQAASRENMLHKAVNEQKQEFDRLNARSFEYQNFKREAEADKNLYAELVRKIKEASINSSFQNSSIRIADPARPPLLPVYPSIPFNLLVAFAASLLLACGAAILSDLLDNTIRDPEQVLRTLQTVVLGSLPIVKNWRGKLPAARGGAEVARLDGVSEQECSSYDEAIRTLRNSILLADFDRRLRSLLITSASPAEGKSTIAVRLATAHAEQHRKTLLIDGDLRRPSVHRKLGIGSGAGLSTVLVSGLPWKEAITNLAQFPGLDILTAGPVSRRSSELLEKRLLQILEEASLTYDLVILDGPPVLGFAEPLHMATAVDGVVVVGRAGHTSRKAIGSVLAVLTRLRANVLGLVLNEVHKEMSDSYYYYGHYGKYYRPNEVEA
jgi:capsular exopolysaccharide synthesis family protein